VEAWLWVKGVATAGVVVVEVRKREAERRRKVASVVDEEVGMAGGCLSPRGRELGERETR